MNVLKIDIEDNKEYIIDSRVRDILNNDCWLAGGAAKSIITREFIEDYDLFFSRSLEKDHAENYFTELGFIVVFRCPAGELLTLKNGQVKVQLITKQYYNSFKECIDTFDLTPSMFAFKNDGVVYTYQQCLDDVNEKVLGLNVVTYPVATIKRVHKYINKGYKYTEEFGQRLVQEINGGVFDDEHLELYVD